MFTIIIIFLNHIILNEDIFLKPQNKKPKTKTSIHNLCQQIGDYIPYEQFPLNKWKLNDEPKFIVRNFYRKNYTLFKLCTLFWQDMHAQI